MVRIMGRVVFMCGPSGAGKTTYAKRLEDEGMERLSFDIEMWRRGIRTVPLPPETRADIEHALRSRLLQLVANGTGVVLDFSFWSRQMRDDWRKVLEPTGVVPETIYLATDRATVLQRVRDRQGDHSDDYVLPERLATTSTTSRCPLRTKDPLPSSASHGLTRASPSPRGQRHDRTFLSGPIHDCECVGHFVSELLDQ